MSPNPPAPLAAAGCQTPRPEDLSARHWDAVAAAGQRAAWTQHPLIEMAVCLRITNGPPKFWVDWLLEDQLARTFERALSVGCGTGVCELMMARTGRVKQIEAFDLSRKSLEIARNSAQAAGIDSINFFEAGFDDFDSKLGDRKYDLICFFGALHHVREIESMLEAVDRRLLPGGRIVFNEYTGDCYTILSERKVNTINRLLATLDPVFLNPDRPRYVNPTLDHMLAADPSEGVRAALILPFLQHRFDIELLRPFGGALLMMLYPSLNHEKLTDGSAESQSIMRLLIEMERVLYEDAGYLPSDHHVGICRKRDSAAA